VIFKVREVNMKKVLGMLWTWVMVTTPLAAEEGMWTFDNPPAKALAEKYGFTPEPAWYDALRLASVRFMDGGSGSFISRRGLVLTNHHVAVGQLQKMSGPERDYVATGFYADAPEKEIKCPDLELNVLVYLENVTEKILAVSKDLGGEAAVKARDAEKARLKKQYQDERGGVAEVVTLYQGGEYWLYGYRKITDVRLVFAPERQIAYFGGDYDNFTYPRYDLDFAIFRAYENDRPLEVENFLRFNTSGAREGDLVFVSGHPGRTSRLYTSAQLDLEREVGYPLALDFFESNLQALRRYAQRGPEQQRRALVRIFGLENARKAYLGMLQSLNDPQFVQRQREGGRAVGPRVERPTPWAGGHGIPPDGRIPSGVEEGVCFGLGRHCQHPFPPPRAHQAVFGRRAARFGPGGAGAEHRHSGGRAGKA
jgi:hypothetical protein